MTTKTDKHEYLRKAHQAANDFKYGYVTISNSNLGALLAERDVLREALADLVQGYVNTLESGRDRIVELGGQCDPVDVMEAADPYLRAARAALAQEQGEKYDNKD